MKTVSSLDRDNTLWEQDLGIADLKMGDAHAALRQFAIANSEYNTSVKIAKSNWRRDKDNALWRNNLAYAYQRQQTIYLIGVEKMKP